MESIRKIFQVGYGPSSSHTIGPTKAAIIFKERNKEADKFTVDLYGSIALTGKGHLTDKALYRVFGEDLEIKFDFDTHYDFHPNGLKFYAYKEGELIDEWLIFSIGGGELKELGHKETIDCKEIYKQTTFNEILEYCKEHHLSLFEYIIKHEDKDILEFAKSILKAMFDNVERGRNKEGKLSAQNKLFVKRKSKEYYDKYKKSGDFDVLVMSNALAVAEENAEGGTVVTAPTCGSSGVMPGVLKAYYDTKRFSLDEIVKALLVGGLVGNLIKTNGSISGAEVGCQGEIGSACSMTAAAVLQLFGASNDIIEYGAEIALEHHLGLTCDPVLGYVLIPCIERNAIAALRAIDAAKYAYLSDGTHYITFDMAVNSMIETGKDLKAEYKETGIGGLAKHIK